MTLQIETIAAQRNTYGIERFSMASDVKPPVAVKAPALTKTLAKTLAQPARRPSAAMIGIALGLFLVAGTIVALTMSRQADARSVDAETSVPTTPAVPTTVTVPAALAWVEINRPIQLFELAGSDFSKLTLSYRARRRPDGNGRQDYLAYGRFGGDRPYLSLSIARTGATMAAGTKLFVDMARLAATEDLAVTHSSTPDLMTTRFGGFAVADIVVAHGAQTLPCLGFRLQPDQTTAGPVAMSGFACGTAEKVIDRAALACVLDRIDLVSAGDDEPLRDFFVEAERRRGQECAGSRLVAGGARGSWLDAGAAPALKRSAGAKNR